VQPVNTRGLMWQGAGSTHRSLRVRTPGSVTRSVAVRMAWLARAHTVHGMFIDDVVGLPDPDFLSTGLLPTDAPSEPAASSARRAADESASWTARQAYDRDGLPEMAADELIAGHLLPGEKVHAAHARVVLNDVGRPTGVPGHGGSLYLTSARVVHVSQIVVSVRLRDIEELAIAGDRLLLSTETGDGMSLDAPQPRLLRVQIAAARTAART
jgi:hypothetical protein